MVILLGKYNERYGDQVNFYSDYSSKRLAFLFSRMHVYSTSPNRINRFWIIYAKYIYKNICIDIYDA